MQTIVINNINDEIVERFKAFAFEMGVSMSIFKDTSMVNVQAKNAPQNLHEALLNIPKADDNEDLFVSSNEPMQAVDWSE